MNEFAQKHIVRQTTKNDVLLSEYRYVLELASIFEMLYGEFESR